MAVQEPRFITPSYPTNCLKFLDSVASPTASPNHDEKIHFTPREDEPLQAEVRLKILIVGAGIGGLSTAVALARRGHVVTVLEQSPRLGEVGAGIQVPPNSARLLHRWGVMDLLGSRAVQLNEGGMAFRRWQDGKKIGFTDLSVQGGFVGFYGCPYYVVHRAHLHDALHERGVELGVEVVLGARVVRYEDVQGDGKAKVLLEDGREFEGDLIVAADGIKSLARDIVSPRNISSRPKPTGYAVYRATVEVAKMRAYPELDWIFEKPGLNLWIGHERHAITYSISGGESYNVVLSHPDPVAEIGDHSTGAIAPESSPSQEEIVKTMLSEYEGWDPALVKILELVEPFGKSALLKWPLMGGDEVIRHWVSGTDSVVHPNGARQTVTNGDHEVGGGRIVVLGDAAHAMLPYMSQGAAMAVEDGAALAVSLNKLRLSSSPRQTPNQANGDQQHGSQDVHDDLSLQKQLTTVLTQIFQPERLSRTQAMLEATQLNSKLWHFPDGPYQRARDEAMRPEVEGRHFLSSPNQWSDPVSQNWAYGYDAEEATERRWVTLQSVGR